MTFWNIFGNFATSDRGETIQRVSSSTSVSSNGTIYTTAGHTTTGSDGSLFTQMGSFSSDGSELKLPICVKSEPSDPVVVCPAVV